MGLPTSGQISMDDIRIELGVPTQSPFDLDTARSGGYVTLNVNSPTLPPSTGQVSLSDWYGYCQTCDTYYFTGGGNTIDACVNNDPVLIISNTIPIGVGSILTYSNGAAVNNPYYYSDGNNWYYVEMNVSEQTEVIEIGSCTTTSTTTTTTSAPVPYTIDSFGTGSSFDACTYGSPSVSVYASYFYNVPMVGMIFYDSPSLTTPYVGGSGWRKFTNGSTNYAGEVDTNGELTNYVTC
jgi:hypothetical protein